MGQVSPIYLYLGPLGIVWDLPLQPCFLPRGKMECPPGNASWPRGEASQEWSTVQLNEILSYWCVSRREWMGCWGLLGRFPAWNAPVTSMNYGNCSGRCFGIPDLVPFLDHNFGGCLGPFFTNVEQSSVWFFSVKTTRNGDFQPKVFWGPEA